MPTVVLEDGMKKRVADLYYKGFIATLAVRELTVYDPGERKKIATFGNNHRKTTLDITGEAVTKEGWV